MFNNESILPVLIVSVTAMGASFQFVSSTFGLVTGGTVFSFLSLKQKEEYLLREFEVSK